MAKNTFSTANFSNKNPNWPITTAKHQTCKLICTFPTKSVLFPTPSDPNCLRFCFFLPYFSNQVRLFCADYPGEPQIWNFHTIITQASIEKKTSGKSFFGVWNFYVSSVELFYDSSRIKSASGCKNLAPRLMKALWNSRKKNETCQTLWCWSGATRHQGVLMMIFLADSNNSSCLLCLQPHW